MVLILRPSSPLSIFSWRNLILNSLSIYNRISIVTKRIRGGMFIYDRSFEAFYCDTINVLPLLRVVFRRSQHAAAPLSSSDIPCADILEIWQLIDTGSDYIFNITQTNSTDSTITFPSLHSLIIATGSLRITAPLHEAFVLTLFHQPNAWRRRAVLTEDRHGMYALSIIYILRTSTVCLSSQLER